MQELAEGDEAEVTWELGGFLAQDLQLLAVQQLLIKGLFKPETDIATIQVGTFLKSACRLTCQSWWLQKVFGGCQASSG